MAKKAKKEKADGNGKLSAKKYAKELRRLQVELCHLQEWVKHKRLRVIVIFEGRDGAGKGGTIRALTERVSPRVFRLVALPAPSDREKSQMYMQRYMAHFPASGEVVIFDRSWYNRAGVERVMGFCTDEQYERFLELCPEMEKYIVDAGILLLKYWLEVGNKEQERRFAARITDPLRQWKLSPMDLPGRSEMVRVLPRARPDAQGDRHPARSLVHRPLRRQEAGAPELHRALPEPDPVQEGAAREDQAAEALEQGRLRRPGDPQRQTLRSRETLSAFGDCSPGYIIPGVTANLTPQYHDAEERFKRAADHAEKLAALREMIALLPKHKGTEKLLADLRKRFSKLEDEAAHRQRGGPGHRVEVGHVRREGAGQWVLLGPPNAGKSSLLAALTHAHPEVGDYPFTTRVPLPGMMAFEDVQVQLVDTPGRRRGAHGAVPPEPRARRRRRPPRPRRDGGRRRGRRAPPPRPPRPRPRLAADAAAAAGRPALPPAEARPRPREQEPRTTTARSPRSPARRSARISPSSPSRRSPARASSALREVLFRELKRIRIYGKEPGKKPDFERPFVLPEGATIHDLAAHVHKEIAERLKFARLWGHAKFDGQQVDRHHVLADKDVVELHA